MLAIVERMLRGQYRTRTAASGAEALAMARAEPPDLVLLDVMMPGMNGFEVCRELKLRPETRDVPVIFLTALDDAKDEKTGFEVGAVDYITKPVSQPILHARVKNHLSLKAAADFLKDNNRFLLAEVTRRTEQVQIVQDVTIMAMASLAETRDNATGNHIRRTQHYVRALAEKLQSMPRYRGEFDDETIVSLFKSAPLHDIGKVGIPDAILLKPGKLTPEEYEIMKTHTVLGRDTILAAEKWIGAPSSFLRHAREIAMSHQEKWDGSGYPEGLKGDAIPMPARLMALADVYDALISKRYYKPAWPHEAAVQMIQEGRGTHFDPDITDAFLLIQDQFRAIASRFAG
ncbi:MAG: two-component system response regulator [Burkholderiales bacterium]|nr:two-component system response regulator [Burkholderiales bacterium]